MATISKTTDQFWTEVISNDPGVNANTLGCDESTSQIADLPEDLLDRIFKAVDADTMSIIVPAVCKGWRDKSRQPDLWAAHVSPAALEQLDALGTLGSPIFPAHLYLALHGRNWLRNPEFRRDDNKDLLPPVGSLGAGGLSSWVKGQRTAWVVNTNVGKEVQWERAPQGMVPEEDASASCPPFPPPPLPYPGTRRLGSYFQQALRGIHSLVGPAAAAVTGVAEAAGSRGQQESPSSSGGESGGPGEARRAVAETACLATLDTWSEVVQVIDLHWELQRRGFSSAQATHLLDSGLGLRLSVYVGSRFDCAGEYAVCLVLDEGGAAAIPSLQSFVMRPSRHLGYRECEHMQYGTWQRFDYDLAACPQGCRRAVVMLRGRRSAECQTRGAEAPTRFCGAKFASAQLVFA